MTIFDYVLILSLTGFAQDGVVRGQVLEDDLGQPVPGAVVTAINSSGTSQQVNCESGEYSLTLRPGHWFIRASAPGFYPEEREVEVEGPGEVIENIPLRRIHCKIKVLAPDGRPIEEHFQSEEDMVSMGVRGEFYPSDYLALVVSKSPIDELSPYPFRFGGFKYFPSSLGRFLKGGGVRGVCLVGGGMRKVSVSDDCFGLMELKEPPPVWVGLALGDQLVCEPQRIEEHQESLTFVVEREKLLELLSVVKLRFIDRETREPIQYPSVVLKRVMELTLGSAPVVPTNDEGEVWLENQLPGMSMLWFFVDGYESCSRQRPYVYVEPGEVVDLGDIALSPTRRIAGRVEMPDGESSQDVNYWVRSLDKLQWFPEQPIQPWWHDTLKPGDRFEVEELGAGRYLLFVGGPDTGRQWFSQGEWAVNPLVVDTRGGSVKDLVYSLRRGTEVGVLTPRELAGGCTASIYDEDGILCWMDEVNPGAEYTVRLIPGKYKLRGYHFFSETYFVDREFVVEDQPVKLEL